MTPKIAEFRAPNLNVYLTHPDRSDFIRNMEDLYRNVQEHLEVCSFIAREHFGKDFLPEHTLEVSHIVVAFMGGVPEFEGEPIQADGVKEDPKC